MNKSYGLFRSCNVYTIFIFATLSLNDPFTLNDGFFEIGFLKVKCLRTYKEEGTAQKCERGKKYPEHIL